MIKQVAIELTNMKIPYQFDASTSVFVQGIDFDMDDIDIIIQWDCFEKAHRYFKKYGASPINNTGFWEFYFIVDGMKVHIMSSERCLNLEYASERVTVVKDNQVIWAKALEFYRRHHSDNHPLSCLIDDFLARKKIKG